MVDNADIQPLDGPQNTFNVSLTGGGKTVSATKTFTLTPRSVTGQDATADVSVTFNEKW